jgi:hypothetical protein
MFMGVNLKCAHQVRPPLPRSVSTTHTGQMRCLPSGLDAVAVRRKDS